jgi:hypothetical protein
VTVKYLEQEAISQARFRTSPTADIKKMLVEELLKPEIFERKGSGEQAKEKFDSTLSHFVLLLKKTVKVQIKNKTEKNLNIQKI